MNPEIDVEASNDSIPEICEVSEFIACLNVRKTKCIYASVQSNKNCSEKYSVELSLEKENEELYAAAEKYGNCVMNDFIDLMGIPISQFETCSVHLEPFFSKLEENARKEQKKLNDSFFNTD